MYHVLEFFVFGTNYIAKNGGLGILFALLIMNIK